MTDDDFLQLEMQVRETLNEFNEACDEKGYDFKERTDDIIFDIAGE